MFDEIKRIKLDELNKEREEFQKQIKEIYQVENMLQKQIFDLNYKLQLMYSNTPTINIFASSSNLPIKEETFSFFEKLFTKRKEYKNYKKSTNITNQIAKLKEELDKEHQKAEEKIQSLGYDKKNISLNLKLQQLKDAKSLHDIGFSPIEAIKFLENRGITPVLNESDKTVSDNPVDYSSKSSLIGIHKTYYMPTDNTIKTPKASHVMAKDSITINGKKYNYSFPRERNSVHMSMNDEVASHSLGSWEDCPYAVLVPFQDIPNEKIGLTSPVDTFTQGNLELSKNSWILCPQNELAKAKALNPNAHILAYKGNSVLGYSKPFLTQLGYHAETVGQDKWSDDKSTEKFINLVKKEKLNLGSHFYSYFRQNDRILELINKSVAICKIIRDNNLIKSPEDFENINNQLKKDGSDFKSLLRELSEPHDKTAKDYNPLSIADNNFQMDILLKTMEKNNFTISPAYKKILLNLSQVPFSTEFNETTLNNIFNIPEQTTTEEKNRISKLKDVISLPGTNNSQKKLEAYLNFISTTMFDSILHSKEKEISTKPKTEHLKEDEDEER